MCKTIMRKYSEHWIFLFYTGLVNDNAKIQSMEQEIRELKNAVALISKIIIYILHHLSA